MKSTIINCFVVLGSTAFQPAQVNASDAAGGAPLSKITWEWFDGHYREPTAQELDDMLQATNNWFGDLARAQYPNLVEWNFIVVERSELDDQNSALQFEFEIDTVFDEAVGTVPSELEVLDTVHENTNLVSYMLDGLFPNLPVHNTFQNVQQVTWEVLDTDQDGDASFDAGDDTDTGPNNMNSMNNMMNMKNMMNMGKMMNMNNMMNMMNMNNMMNVNNRANTKTMGTGNNKNSRNAMNMMGTMNNMNILNRMGSMNNMDAMNMNME